MLIAIKQPRQIDILEGLEDTPHQKFLLYISANSIKWLLCKKFLKEQQYKQLLATNNNNIFNAKIYLKGLFGDKMNLIHAAAAMNFNPDCS